MASCVNCEHLKAHNCRHQCLDLPAGKTCGECAFFGWCSALLGDRVKADNTSCDYEPVRFREKKAQAAV